MNEISTQESVNILRLFELPKDALVCFDDKIEIIKFLMELDTRQRLKIEQKLPRCCGWLTSVKKTQLIPAVIKVCAETESSMFYRNTICINKGHFCVSGTSNHARSELIMIFDKYKIADFDICAWWKRYVRPMKSGGHVEKNYNNELSEKSCFHLTGDVYFLHDSSECVPLHSIQTSVSKKISSFSDLKYIVAVMKLKKKDRPRYVDSLPKNFRWLETCKKTQNIAAVLKVILDLKTEEFIWSNNECETYDFYSSLDLVSICEKVQFILKSYEIDIDVEKSWRQYVRYASPDVQLISFKNSNVYYYFLPKKPDFFKPDLPIEDQSLSTDVEQKEEILKKRKFSTTFICGETIGKMQCGAEFDQRRKLMKHIYDHIPTRGWERKIKQKKIANLLSNNNVLFEEECYVNFRCLKVSNSTKSEPALIPKLSYLSLADELKKSYVFIDFLITTDRCIIALEIDEHQHSEGNNPWGYTIS